MPTPRRARSSARDHRAGRAGPTGPGAHQRARAHSRSAGQREPEGAGASHTTFLRPSETSGARARKTHKGSDCASEVQECVARRFGAFQSAPVSTLNAGSWLLECRPHTCPRTRSIVQAITVPCALKMWSGVNTTLYSVRILCLNPRMSPIRWGLPASSAAKSLMTLSLLRIPQPLASGFPEPRPAEALREG